MSLSSASSLERNDTSEEFLDDFDNLGDQLQIGIPQNKYPVTTPTQMRLQGLLNETMYWTRIGLTGIAKCYSSNSCIYVTNSTMLINIVLLWQACSVYAVILWLFSGGKADSMGGLLRGPTLMSPDVDRHTTSSLELSPSNSSGGTYMWDEEGMEPLGHNTHIHCCSSYESDLNSIVSILIPSQLPLEKVLWWGLWCSAVKTWDLHFKLYFGI